ncbi:SDR family oxidoreductase [Roseomonas sp. NAR14]|uniref:SDR family oxidoreductase n=1 Tax=Roseomonas acroporae TaxID=2937791 RepID=A0A9X1YBG1_9PROT|nr:SDR family oxidoreductase [Roseomonas acroporae]MCK8786640.1 SDR family oxidoreductase [Roseomonas acroporae]
MDLGLKGRRALVMGGTKGLGRSIADALAGEGAALVISGRDQSSLDKAAAELKAAGAAAAYGVPADISSAEQIEALADKAVELLGGVDILVINHGGPPPGTALDIRIPDLEAWFPRIVVNPIRIAHKLLPAMQAQKWGRIIVVGSTGMLQPIPGIALSNILRAGMVGWMKTISGQVAKDGVTVNILAPGTIRTDRTKETIGGAAKRQGISMEEAEAASTKEIPAGRLGDPKEYGPMGAFLAGDTGAYITGCIVRVDGGRVKGML